MSTRMNHTEEKEQVFPHLFSLCNGSKSKLLPQLSAVVLVTLHAFTMIICTSMAGMTTVLLKS